MSEPAALFYRIWKAGASCTHILEGHTSTVTSVCILNTEGCSCKTYFSFRVLTPMMHSISSIKWKLNCVNSCHFKVYFNLIHKSCSFSEVQMDIVSWMKFLSRILRILCYSFLHSALGSTCWFLNLNPPSSNSSCLSCLQLVHSLMQANLFEMSWMALPHGSQLSLRLTFIPFNLPSYLQESPVCAIYGFHLHIWTCSVNGVHMYMLVINFIICMSPSMLSILHYNISIDVNLFFCFSRC